MEAVGGILLLKLTALLPYAAHNTLRGRIWRAVLRRFRISGETGLIGKFLKDPIMKTTVIGTVLNQPTSRGEIKYV